MAARQTSRAVQHVRRVGSGLTGVDLRLRPQDGMKPCGRSRRSTKMPRCSTMAKCDEGYLCDVCGGDVASIVDSDLYLRYVIGELDPEVLHTSPERHLRCNPVLAQFIDHENFDAVIVAGDFAKEKLDAGYRNARTELVTRGYVRLLEIAATEGDRDVTTYPLDEAIAKYRSG